MQSQYTMNGTINKFIEKIKITLQDNIGDRTFKMEPSTEELKDLDNFQQLVKDKVSKALDIAEEIWKKYPEFRQITLDTTTDEERKLMAMAQRSNMEA